MAVKRFRSIALRIGIGLAVLLVAGFFVSLDRVDYRPYLRQPYYLETTARFRSTVATNEVTRGELHAGFGRALLTPTINAPADEPQKGAFSSLPLAGYGARRGRPAAGVHDDLFVKAVAFQVGTRVGVMVGADALIIPAEVTDAVMQRVQTELRLTREQIYLSATHTHCSLGGWGEGLVAEAFSGEFQPGSRVWFADRIVTAVREALADLKPASLGQGRFAAPEFIRNRLVGDLGKVDSEFSWLLLKQAGGKAIVLGSYGAHATVLGSGMMEFSADYPGCWQRAVAEATGGAAVFLAGGVGSHSPVSGGKGFAGAERMGLALARRLLDQLADTPVTNWVSFGTVGLDVTLPPLNVRVSDGLRLRPWLARQLLPVRPQSYLQAFRFDEVVWVSTPCDFSGELALGIKDFMRARGRNAVITSFNGDYIGYVIPTRYYHLDGYEPRVMSFFGPNVPDYLDEFIRAMAIQLVEK